MALENRMTTYWKIRKKASKGALSMSFNLGDTSNFLLIIVLTDSSWQHTMDCFFTVSHLLPGEIHLSGSRKLYIAYPQHFLKYIKTIWGSLIFQQKLLWLIASVKEDFDALSQILGLQMSSTLASIVKWSSSIRWKGTKAGTSKIKCSENSEPVNLEEENKLYNPTSKVTNWDL